MSDLKILWVDEEAFPVAIMDGVGLMMRGSINGIEIDYTLNGWLIDYSQEYVRVQIVERKWLDMEENLRLGELLRSSRTGALVKLRLAFGEHVEYDGDAEVQMIRFRAQRKSIPRFRIQLKLLRNPQ